MKIDFAALGDEGFTIQTSGPHLVIAGGRLRGTMYGVYAFLEEVLGCRWYAPGASFIPKKPTIKIGKPEYHRRRRPSSIASRSSSRPRTPTGPRATR